MPPLRIRALRDQPPSSRGEYVLHWMIGARRLADSFAIDRAVELAQDLNKPLVILEPLRCGYPWASDRLHAFVLDGMSDGVRALEGTPVAHHPYVERAPGEGRGLLEALAERACAVVTDDVPGFFLPRMVDAAARKLRVRLEAVDSNGLLPLRAVEKVYGTAHELRRFVQKTLREHLDARPSSAPALDELREAPRFPRAVLERWQRATPELLARERGALAALPIDHSVPPVEGVRGGPVAAEERLQRFLAEGLARYVDERNEPESEAPSGLSPYLHFGHISAHRVFAAVTELDDWSPRKLAAKATGRREGWWGASAPVEAFLDQLVTWRELGFNLASKRPDELWSYESLPGWARHTLEVHARDARPVLYTASELEAARTHDPLWNAAQMQLVREGTIANYLRMLWGKKILEWSRTPREALEVMIHLNNKYALDGRDPNSASGIFWCLGRYDRPWGPERPIFGTVRYMTSTNTARKVHTRDYVARHAARA